MPLALPSIASSQTSASHEVKISTTLQAQKPPKGLPSAASASRLRPSRPSALARPSRIPAANGKEVWALLPALREACAWFPSRLLGFCRPLAEGLRRRVGGLMA